MSVRWGGGGGVVGEGSAGGSDVGEGSAGETAATANTNAPVAQPEVRAEHICSSMPKVSAVRHACDAHRYWHALSLERWCDDRRVVLRFDRACTQSACVLCVTISRGAKRDRGVSGTRNQTSEREGERESHADEGGEHATKKTTVITSTRTPTRTEERRACWRRTPRWREQIHLPVSSNVKEGTYARRV